jgi:hypothetical protein
MEMLLPLLRARIEERFRQLGVGVGAGVKCPLVVVAGRASEGEIIGNGFPIA